MDDKILIKGDDYSLKFKSEKGIPLFNSESSNLFHATTDIKNSSVVPPDRIGFLEVDKSLNGVAVKLPSITGELVLSDLGDKIFLKGTEPHNYTGSITLTPSTATKLQAVEFGSYKDLDVGDVIKLWNGEENNFFPSYNSVGILELPKSTSVMQNSLMFQPGNALGTFDPSSIVELAVTRVETYISGHVTTAITEVRTYIDEKIEDIAIMVIDKIEESGIIKSDIKEKGCYCKGCGNMLAKIHDMSHFTSMVVRCTTCKEARHIPSEVAFKPLN